MGQHQGTRVVKAAGEDSAEARERIARARMADYLVRAAAYQDALPPPPPLTPAQRRTGAVLARAYAATSAG